MAVALAVRPVAALARPSAAGARARGGRRDGAPRRRGARAAAAVAAPAEGDAGNASAAPSGERGPSLASQVLAGLTVSLAMVPEALAFTFVAGVPPLVGLHAAAVMCACTALLGAQPGVISGAAGATAVVFAPLVASHGLEYLFAAVVLAGAMQVVAGVARLGKFIRLVPAPVMSGFVNGLAIVIGMAQLAQFKSGGVWLSGAPLYTMLALTALTMAIIKIWPRVTKAVPAPLVAIGAVTLLVGALDIPTRTVGDLAPIAGGLPAFHFPQVPLSFDTLALIAPYAAAVAAVGLIETLLTQQVVDELTETRTETHTECVAQGVAQIATGFTGGMGGCAMIGQSALNVQSGGRRRLAGLTCAAALFAFTCACSGVIAAVPLAALAGTMLCLVGDIFDFDSVRNLRKVPKTDAAVLVLVTGVTYATNLAVAVFAGVVLSALGFSWKSATRGVTATRTIEPAAYEGRPATVYAIHGPVFFGSVTAFKDALVAAGVLTDGNGDGAGGNTRTDEEIVLDFADARVWDSSALSAVSEAAARLESTGARVHLRHLSPDCARLLERAGDLVEVNVLEDPRYGVLADYPTTAVDTSIEGLARVVPTYRAPAYDVTGAIATQLERSAKRQEEDAKLTPAQKEARMFSYEE